MKIRITGIGCVSALGLNVEEQRAALRSSRCGIQPNRVGNVDVLAGAAPASNDQLKDMLGIDRDEVISRTALLGIHAAREALAGLPQTSGKTAFVNATTVGGMDLTEDLFMGSSSLENGPLEVLVHHDLGSVTRVMTQYLQPFDYVNTLSTACSSAANAILLGKRLLESGQYSRVVVGGTDALSEFTIRGFSSLMLYSDALCRPFDEARNGLNLGEGAAYLVMEMDKGEPNHPTFGYLIGGGNANDAHHITATSPEGRGAQSAMNLALQSAGLTANEVDYINAHGTATNNNDASEAAAMTALFGNQWPAVNSTKSFTGHTLAACGAIEAVFSLLSLKYNELYPSLNVDTSILPEGVLIPSAEERPLRRAMSNSFGFGGNSTSLLFETV